METEIEHHHDSHRSLVDLHPDGPEAGGSGAVDAIVVPTIRHPKWLEYAIRLAIALDCTLVTLHSKWSKPGLADALMPAGVRFIAVGIDDPARLNLPDFATTALVKGTPFARATDLSAKRNTGLLLARLTGWRRIVFLDDDIEVGGHEEVARAAALLDTYDAVGMHIGGYPDNSVVCHAHRLTGGRQDSFVGGGALAVETTRNPSFFPNIYNEDWFYLLGERSLRRLAVTGRVKQRPYDPFDRPVRARDQELGDVLAEGVYWLLDEGRGWAAATGTAYWKGFLARRTAFVRDVLRRVRELPPGATTNRRAMEESLLAALGRLSRITPEFCVRYLEAWSEDRHRWSEHLEKVPHIGLSVADVMKWLVHPGSEQLPRWTSFDS
ncbi:hypothetical protein FH608_001190 [Nonomuraea phyllanthi]|uniref:Uncharacterized protein n=1 Tax=Nonomuraea phyllanthi TaxID=2219224 RepID=A0A5C4WVJ9_9ACTN|nr:hypothetical protein [Nonomuraea phyllanthi]KAB8197212.1 hypothetical protein FH608_001190 [Nonomuraea phyllanthi]QFY06790.1 hypothetical protein GBF35_08875 [Nonomuraea phyllanthi]